MRGKLGLLGLLRLLGLRGKMARKKEWKGSCTYANKSKSRSPRVRLRGRLGMLGLLGLLELLGLLGLRMRGAAIDDFRF